MTLTWTAIGDSKTWGVAPGKSAPTMTNGWQGYVSDGAQQQSVPLLAVGRHTYPWTCRPLGCEAYNNRSLDEAIADVPAMLAAFPAVDAYVIDLGIVDIVNDAVDDVPFVINRLARLASAILRQNPTAWVLQQTLIPCTNHPERPTLNTFLDDVNAAMQPMLTALGAASGSGRLRLIDHRPTVSIAMQAIDGDCDGLHPALAVYPVMSQPIYQALVAVQSGAWTGAPATW